MYQVVIADGETKIWSGLANSFPWNQLGFEIISPFSDGKDVYDFVLLSPVDLILSDTCMFFIDGLELSERLLSRRKIRIVSSGGYQDFNYMWKALCNDAFNCLLEPVKYGDLADCLTRIKELLGSEQSQDMPEVCESLSYYEKITNTIKNYLDTSYQDATLEQAARLMPLSPNYLSRIIKEHSDADLSNHLLKTQMENAARMLGDIGYKQYEITYRVGYDNPRNFSRASHQYFSMMPTQHRNYGGCPKPQL